MDSSVTIMVIPTDNPTLTTIQSAKKSFKSFIICLLINPPIPNPVPASPSCGGTNKASF